MDYRLETVETDDGNEYYVHFQGEETTNVVAFCTDFKWAKKVMDGLKWLDAAETGLLSIPKRKPPVKLVFTPAKKPVKRSK